eukprot:4742179-Ditylum_brightwellii.AAC.1
MNDAIPIVYSSQGTTLPKDEYSKDTSFEPQFDTDNEASDTQKQPMETRETKRQVINDEPLHIKWEDDSNSYKLGRVVKYVGGDAMELVTVE